MERIIIKVKDYVKFHNEIYVPLEEVRRSIIGPISDENTISRCHYKMDNLWEKLDNMLKDICSTEGNINQKIVDMLLAENINVCPVDYYPKKIDESVAEIQRQWEAILYYNSVVDRANWILHWHLITNN